MAKRKGITKLLVCVDSRIVEGLLCSDLPRASPFYNVLKQCKLLIETNGWQVRFKHYYREANRAANWLANKAVVMEEKLSFISVPVEGLSSILLDDIAGVAFPRMIVSFNFKINK